MTKCVFQLRLSLQEKERWQGFAGSKGLSAWLRGLVNEECDRLEAEGKDQGLSGLSRREVDKRERLAELAKAFPQRVVSPSGGKRTYKPDPR